MDKEQGGGVYYCAVSGRTHVSSLSAHVPEVTSRAPHVSTVLGRGAVLECVVRAAPVPAITWARQAEIFLQKINIFLEFSGSFPLNQL